MKKELTISDLFKSLSPSECSRFIEASEKILKLCPEDGEPNFESVKYKIIDCKRLRRITESEFIYINKYTKLYNLTAWIKEQEETKIW